MAIWKSQPFKWNTPTQVKAQLYPSTSWNSSANASQLSLYKRPSPKEEITPPTTPTTPYVATPPPATNVTLPVVTGSKPPIQGGKTVQPAIPPIDTSGTEYQRMVQIGQQLHESGQQDPALMREIQAYYQKYAPSWALQGINDFNSFLAYLLENTRSGEGKDKPPPATNPDAGAFDKYKVVRTSPYSSYVNGKLVNRFAIYDTATGAFITNVVSGSLTQGEIDAAVASATPRAGTPVFPTDFRVPNANVPGGYSELRGPSGSFGRKGALVSDLLKPIGKGLVDADIGNDAQFLRQLKQIYDMHNRFWLTKGMKDFNTFMESLMRASRPPVIPPTNPDVAAPNDGQPGV
jgi:hypothetical protein